jgi:hypothetical protein
MDRVQKPNTSESVISKFIRLSENKNVNISKKNLQMLYFGKK